jgi:His-Xaa-Ser system radical SAM maturase HxsC
MLLKTKGKPLNITVPVIGRITRNPFTEDRDSVYLNDSTQPYSISGYSKAVLSRENEVDISSATPLVFNIPSFEHLSEGDLVSISTDGFVNTLYRINSHHNFLLVTERCNSNCLMCSQPPKDRDDIPYLFDIYCQLIPLIPKDCIELVITGGEPTLMGDRFFWLLDHIKNQLPETEIHCLTNGRSFAWPNFAKKLADLELQRLMLGIPLYADHAETHDFVVQATDAFDQTMSGLYNLAKQEQRIEIRIVLHKQTIPRLPQLAKFIYKNLPFVEHVTFMGLEYTGYTPHNIDKLWIDPFDYMHQLEEAVSYLATMGMNVSIYNLQLCLLPESLWRFTKRSISDWKNIYLDECKECSMKDKCGGFFASSEKVHSKYIKALQKFANMQLNLNLSKW